MPQPGPYTKTELQERLKFVRQGWWNQSILVFEDAEYWAETVEPYTWEDETGIVYEYVKMVGKNMANQKPVIMNFDPRDVTRIVH